jgi:hypothetical protein
MILNKYRWFNANLGAIILNKQLDINEVAI